MILVKIIATILFLPVLALVALLELASGDSFEQTMLGDIWS